MEENIKNLLMVLAIVFVVGVIGSIFVSQNLVAGPDTDPTPTTVKDPRVVYNAVIFCYNYETTDCK